MTYEYASGSMWQGLLADGSFVIEELNQKCIEHCGHQFERDCSGISDLIYRMHKGCQPNTYAGGYEAGGNVHCFYRNLYGSQNIQPICETYVLSAKEKLHETSDIFTRSYSPAIIEEIINAEPNRYLILTFSNCKDLIECKKKVLSELGFMPRDKSEYRHYKKFSNAAQKLINESISFFEAPCCKLFEQLEKQGFTGDHVTYP